MFHNVWVYICESHKQDKFTFLKILFKYCLISIKAYLLVNILDIFIAISNSNLNTEMKMVQLFVWGLIIILIDISINTVNSNITYVLSKTKLNMLNNLTTTFLSLKPVQVEQPEIIDRISITREAVYQTEQALVTVISIVGSIVELLTFLTVLSHSQTSYLFVIPLIVLGLLLIKINVQLGSELGSYYKRLQPYVRKYFSYFEIVTNPKFNKDVRTFRFKEKLRALTNISIEEDLLKCDHDIYDVQKKFVDKTSLISAIQMMILAIWVTYYFQLGIITEDNLTSVFISIGAIIIVSDKLSNSFKFLKLSHEFQKAVIQSIPIEVEKKEKLTNVNYTDINIEFKNVSFSYGDHQVCKNVSFNISNGSKIVFVGENGSGKTTIVKLILGIYKPESGQILINGTNIDNFNKAELKQLFSFSFQNSAIYPLSVAENMLEDDVDEDSLVKYLKLLGLHKLLDISNMLTKEIDDNGIELSGGEKKRLTIVRCLVKKSKCIILDEPTSSLDPINEDKIIDVVLTESRTVIAVIHRMVMCQYFDQIFVVKEGRIVEHGDFNKLLNSKKEFYNMYNQATQKSK